MHDKLELYKSLKCIIMDIEQIIRTVSGHNYQGMDYWLSTICSSVKGDYDLITEVLNKIWDTYNIDEDHLDYIDAHTPFMQIALFIYLKERNGPADGQ